MGPFDVVATFLSVSGFRNNKISDLIDIYFHDFSLSPLMIQENYLSRSPALVSHTPPHKKDLAELNYLKKAALSISDGDLVDKMIHG